jgi:methylated-DNA-[protein]-cysteine S-methyltransferase
VAIVLPCHRIVGSDGSLTGFAGGLETKKWLLAHERAVRERRGAAPETEAAAPEKEGAA